MTKREAAKLACKILAVYVIAFSIIDIPQVIYTISLLRDISGDQTGRLLLASATTTAYFLLKLLFGILLWVLSDRIAVGMSWDTATPTTKQSITSRDYLTIGISIIGVYLVATELVQLVGSSIANSQAAKEQSVPFFEIIKASQDSLVDFWSNVTGFIIGIVLLIGAKGLVNILPATSSISDRPTAAESESI